MFRRKTSRNNTNHCIKTYAGKTPQTVAVHRQNMNKCAYTETSRHMTAHTHKRISIAEQTEHSAQRSTHIRSTERELHLIRAGKKTSAGKVRRLSSYRKNHKKKNAHEHVTRPILSGTLQEKCRTSFSEPAFCVEFFTKDGHGHCTSAMWFKQIQEKRRLRPCQP